MVTTAATTTVPVRPSRTHALLSVLFGTRTPALPADLCLLVVRLTLAFLFIYHGGRRLFGAFGGAGLQQSADYFAQTAHLHPGMMFAPMADT